MDRTVNSVDPNQTAPLAAESGSTLIAQTCLSKNLGSLWQLDANGNLLPFIAC